MSKVSLEEGISNWLFLTIVLFCASPAITLNVWPRIDAMIGNGVTSNSIGIVLLVTLSALGMTAVPFAMKKAENIGFWLTCLAFGIGLGLLNYTMAVGAVGKSRDEEAGNKALVIQKAGALRAAIAESEVAKKALPAFRWTSPAMVESAANAVALADSARKDECGKVGDHCRARVAQLGNRQSELADISSHRALTERAVSFDESLQRMRAELSALGSIPTSTDQQAGRIASVVGAIIKLGPDATESVASGLIHFLAICAEAFALGMPRIIVTALASPRGLKSLWTGNENVQKLSMEQPAKNVPKSTPKPQPRPTTLRNNLAPISEWRATFLIRSSSKIRDWEAYEAYKKWAKEKRLEALSFLSFDQELQALGVAKETDQVSKRDFYLELAIKQPLKAVS